jgi:GR25 family glycosyltransferase involved in LPS biosynthesis
MTGVPPIHLINLDRSTERLRLFNEHNAHIANVTRVSAVDGHALDRDALVAAGYITADLNYGPGTLGCAMSHIRLWEMAAAEDRSITIFEDDVIVSHQFQNRAQDILSELPADWDFIQWGCQLNPLFAWVDLGVSRARLHAYGARRYAGAAGRGEFQRTNAPSSAVKLLHSFGTHAYSISARGARAALEFCLPLRNRQIEFPDAGVRTPDVGIDVSLCGLYPNLNSFLCIPNLVLLGEQESDRKSTDEIIEANIAMG